MGLCVTLSRKVAEKVIMVHRRDTLRATKIYHDPLLQAKNVEFRWNSTVAEILHDKTVNGVRLRDVKTGEESLAECDGVFISVGRKPATELVKGQINLDLAGYIVADESTRTNIPGVFAVEQMIFHIKELPACVWLSIKFLLSINSDHISYSVWIFFESMISTTPRFSLTIPSFWK